MDKIPINREECNKQILQLNMFGRSAAFNKTLRKINRLAQCNAEVLIEGETGTGKELAARALHYLSPRGKYPFIAVNCGALPDTLIESELFGHNKGAFTDAKSKQTGLIEQADGGTLFLDEIEALALKGQVALLRFFQDKIYRPIGSSRSHQADVRIIAASNENIEEMVANGLFRKDLYFRLNLMNITMPPLRERDDDVLLLAEYFLSKYADQYQKDVSVISGDAKKILMKYHWPGNIRELENLIHREVLLAADDEVNIHFDGVQIHDNTARKDEQYSVNNFYVSIDQEFNQSKALIIEKFEKEYLDRLLENTHGNVTLAAKRAGKERRCLGKLIKKHGLDKNKYRIL